MNAVRVVMAASITVLITTDHMTALATKDINPHRTIPGNVNPFIANLTVSRVKGRVIKVSASAIQVIQDLDVKKILMNAN